MAEDTAPAGDLELIARIRAARNDGWVSVWLLVPLVTIPLGAMYGESAALAGVAASILVCAVLLRLRDRLPRHRAAKQAEREYERRFRLHELSAYETEARALLAKPDAPDVVMLFSGHGVPAGIHHFVRLDLGRESRLQVCRAPLLSDVLEVEDPATQLFRYDEPLTAEHETRVRELLFTLTPELLRPPHRFVFDGFPCTAVVLRARREPMWTDLDMAGLPAELYEHPSARLLRLFLELEAEVS